MKIRVRDLYKSYDELRMRLTREEINHPGKVARLFLDAFVGNNARITVEEVERRGICTGQRGDFAAWRERIIQKGWLEWSKLEGVQAGIRLVTFVNQENINTKVLATREDLNGVQQEVKELRSDMDILRRAVENLIDTYDPPCDEAKVEKQLAFARDRLQFN